jgi:hypothetical protein
MLPKTLILPVKPFFRQVNGYINRFQVLYRTTEQHLIINQAVASMPVQEALGDGQKLPIQFQDFLLFRPFSGLQLRTRCFDTHHGRPGGATQVRSGTG